MRILVACEESQAVTKEFRMRGHEAYSCDIIDHSGEHDEWHIKSDVIPLLNGDCEFETVDGIRHKVFGKWDMIIAFPPCTHLAVSGARWFERKRESGEQREGVEFFCRFLEADCDRVVIENPIGIISGDYIVEHFPDIADKYGLPRKPTQVIQPWMWGDLASKSTCLWIKGVEPLVPDTEEQPELDYWVSPDGSKRMERWFYKTRCIPTKDGARAKAASKTFPGIAKAMADQWG